MQPTGLTDRELRLGLSYLRRKRGWTQTDLATRAGMRQDQISKKESGVRRIAASDVPPFAKAFGFEKPEKLIEALRGLAKERPHGYETEDPPEPTTIDLNDYAPVIVAWCRRNSFDVARAIASGIVAFARASQQERIAMSVALDEWIRTDAADPPEPVLPRREQKPVHG